MQRNRWKETLLTFFPCYVFWLLLTLSVKPFELISGAVVCLIVAWFCSAFFVKSDTAAAKMLNPLRLGMLLIYLFTVFVWELIQSNVAMAKTVLLHRPLRQAIVKVPVRGITDPYALAMLSDCITLTPGTITLDVVNEQGNVFLYVQWLVMETDDNEKAGEIIKGRMENWIRRIWK